MWLSPTTATSGRSKLEIPESERVAGDDVRSEDNRGPRGHRSTLNHWEPPLYCFNHQQQLNEYKTVTDLLSEVADRSVQVTGLSLQLIYKSVMSC